MNLLHAYVTAGGMNGSILYELDRPENSGLKKSIKAWALSLLLSCMVEMYVHPIFLSVNTYYICCMAFAFPYLL